jgi:ATP-dependent helicase/nuclease subunit A
MLDGTVNNGITDAEEAKSVSLGAGVVEIEVVSERLTAPGRTKGKSKRAKTKFDWQPFVDAWARRTTACERAQQAAPFVTPTLLKRQEEASTESGSKMTGQIYRQTPALVVGDLAHRFLQNWQFASDVKEYKGQLHDFITLSLPREFASSHREIETELEDIFHAFFRSKAYAELTDSRIVGREVPLLMPWNGQIMEGVIDLIYKKNGLLYLADYKTDRITKDQLAEGAARYNRQAEIYSRAVKQSLGRELAAFKIIFLRLGEAVELGAEKNKELSLF